MNPLLESNIESLLKPLNLLHLTLMYLVAYSIILSFKFIINYVIMCSQKIEYTNNKIILNSTTNSSRCWHSGIMRR